VRVLVTGGAGFIGGALARRLLEAGHEVVVADRRPVAPALAADLHGIVTGDLREPEVADKAVTEGTDAVLHLAAATSVLRSVEDPDDVYRSNVAMTHHLLERCRLIGVPRLVLASTNAVVGTGAGGGVIDESAPLVPLTPYGATKAAGEMLLSAYRSSYGMSTVALRLTNVYGPGVGVKDGLVARLFKAARAGYGIRINGDGMQVRDYVYLDDTIAAFATAVTAAPDSFPGTLVVGSGRSFNVLQLHELVCEVTGTAIPAEHVPAPPGEMRAVVVDRSLAAASGLADPVPLAEGLARTWRAWPDP
jgi:UDP-glucose 4-epimerase